MSPQRVYVAGHRGMVGSAIVRHLQESSDVELITATHAELDLRDGAAVREFIAGAQPDSIYLAAAKVGGIHANNTFPADFIWDNIAIQTNVIGAAHEAGVNRLLLLGSSCIYPRLAAQPMAEEALLTGELEPTNEPYAVAKIAGIKMCESFNRQYGTDYRSVMPTNLYGPGDNFHPENSHVLPALLRRFHEATINGDSSVTIWGTGQPRREFLHVADMAAASVHVMDLDLPHYQSVTTPMSSHINVGWGEDCSIAELASMIAQITGYEGEVAFDTSKPDGAPRKLLDTTRLSTLGWRPTITLLDGLQETYDWYRNSEGHRGQ